MRLKFLLKRLVDKIVKDALPAGLASILGGLLLTHLDISFNFNLNPSAGRGSRRRTIRCLRIPSRLV